MCTGVASPPYALYVLCVPGLGRMMGTGATAHPDATTHLIISLRAGVAFLPYALYVLCAAPLGRALGAAAAALALTAGPLLVTDRLFYGKWTVHDRPGLSIRVMWES